MSKNEVTAAAIFGFAILACALNALGIIPDWPLYAATISGTVFLFIEGAIAP